MAASDADDLEAAATFWSAVSDHFFTNDGAELEYDEFLELATQQGLLALVPYDRTKHEPQMDGDVEPGDMIYWPTDLGARLHARAKEST